MACATLHATAIAEGRNVEAKGNIMGSIIWRLAGWPAGWWAGSQA